jgi:hypothetical protein
VLNKESEGFNIEKGQQFKRLKELKPQRRLKGKVDSG